MTDSSGYYVKPASTDKQKYEEVRRIFGEQAESVLQKCGVIAYDYLNVNMRENYCNTTYVNNSELLSKLKNSVLNDQPENLVLYTRDIRHQTFDWKTRHNEVNLARNSYRMFHAQELADERARAAQKQAATPTVDPKLKAFLTRTIGSDAMAGALTAKYGDKAYAVALSAVMEPGNMVTDLGVKIDGKFSSRNLLATLAKDETKLDNAKLNKFLDDYSARKTKAAAANKKAETENTAEKPDETYGVRAPIKKVEIAKPNLTLHTIDISDLSSIKMTPIKTQMTPVKTPAEQKYDELLAAKRKKSGDEKAYLTCGDLLDAGVDVKKDFRTALKILAINHRDIPEEMYAAFSDRDAVITKDVAMAALAVMQARKNDKHLYAQFQDMAKQPHNSIADDSEQLRRDLQRQKDLAMAQGRIKDHVPTDNVNDARIDAAIAAREPNNKASTHQPVDLALSAQKGPER